MSNNMERMKFSHYTGNDHAKPMSHQDSKL
jgi:hypothetical protein